MSSDPIVAAIQHRATALGQRVAPRARVEDLDRAEARLGFSLPTFYRRILVEVGNGGMGPGPLHGMPPNGYFDRDLRGPEIDDVVDLHLALRAASEHRCPRGLLHLCNWGAGKWSHLDCDTDEGVVLTSEWLSAHGAEHEGLHYWRTSASLREWLHEWTQNDGKWEDLSVEVVGWETRKNPFTGLSRRYPVTRPRGPMIDLGHRV